MKGFEGNHWFPNMQVLLGCGSLALIWFTTCWTKGASISLAFTDLFAPLKWEWQSLPMLILNFQIVKKWLGQIVEALAFVHRHKVIHRYIATSKALGRPGLRGWSKLLLMVLTRVRSNLLQDFTVFDSISSSSHFCNFRDLKPSNIFVTEGLNIKIGNCTSYELTASFNRNILLENENAIGVKQLRIHLRTSFAS